MSNTQVPLFKGECASTSVYFKDPQGVLHKYNVGSDDIPEAIDTVKDMLETTKQAFLGQAVLAVVEGGNSA